MTSSGSIRLAFASFAALVAATRIAHADRPAPGAATADRLTVPSGPSSVRGLAGEPSVDPFAAHVDYQVPIELPSGWGGLAPALALSYSGSLGNGPMGIGWTFGEPRIERSTRLGVPKFDGTDELEISGIVSGRLVSIGSGEYRVEGMGQTVRVRAAAGGGFEVDDGKGIHYRIGTSAQSRQESDPTHTTAWLVEQETNLMGEAITYSYTHDQNQVYLSTITWGPGAMYGAALAYEARTDPTKSFRAGFPVVTAKRLATITATVNGVERRAYHLAYDSTFSVARLAGVTSTGVGGIGAWPALTFTYAAPATPATTPIAGVGGWRLNSNGVSLVDLDGDGAADLLQMASSGHAYLTNENGTFGGVKTLTGNALPMDSLQLQDVDGDARVELLQDTGSGWSVWKFSKTKWVPQAGVWPGSSGLALKQPDSTRFADINGDGLVDAIQWSNDGLQIHLATPTGLLPSHSVARIGGTTLPTSIGRFQDVNGDGLADYVLIAVDHLEVYLGHGDGTFDATTRVTYPFAGTISNPQDIELADLDRDGLMDVVKIQTGTVLWFRGNPDGTFRTSSLTLANPEPLSSSVVVTVADTNGNGSQDIVWSSASGMWRMDLAGTTTAGMLLEVTNGLGLDVTIAYSSSHALSAAARAAGTAWSSEVPIAMPVPVQKTTMLGAGETTRQVTYTVRDGFWDPTEQRFGGFLTTMVTTAGATPAQTSTVNATYNKGAGANRELRGKPLNIQIFDGSGRRLSLITNTWTTIAVTGLPDTPLLRVPVLAETVTQFEDVTPIRKTDVTNAVDGLGRVIHSVNSGRLDLTGDESVTDTSYADDDGTWIRDVVCETKISNVTGTVLSDVQSYFGDDLAEHPLCVVGKGWPRETRAWLASESRYVTQTTTQFDSHRNQLVVTSGGVEHRFVYDATGLFPIEEHATIPSGNELVWLSTWDPVLGAMTSLADPNNHTTHITYDSLGRNTGLAVDGGLQHQVIEYDLTPPYPKTTVWDFDGALSGVTAKPAAWTAASKWRQTVEVRNGLGEVRYHAQRLTDNQWIVSNYREVDPNGNVVFSGQPVISAQLELAGRPAGVVGDTLVYDPLGRLIEQQSATGAQRTFSYVSFERTTQDADQAPVHSVLDGQGRPILTERSLSDGTHEIVQATYDAVGHLTQMTLAGGTVTRTFAYDTLGRLTQSMDPDLGARTLAWDDGNRLLSETNAAGQLTQYTYDSLGRLSTRDTGSLYRYHYDSARPGAGGPAANLASRLAWIEEPTGSVDAGYDELGHQTFTRHQIDEQVSEATTTYAASGLVLGRSFDDGFAFDYRYDAAGRVVGAGDLWTVLDQDASGRPLHETTQNGVDAVFARDVLGLPSRVTLHDADGLPIYDVSAVRNATTDIISEVDHDGIGLDHSATFSYDAFGRMTGATMGTGAQAFTFGYGYDALHNMTSRTASGPAVLGAMFGTYHYGQASHAPRQLTSITDPAGHVTHTFDYDASGRQIAEDALRMTFDASDRITAVTGLAGGPGTVTHTYGQDGQRIKTVEPDGSVSYFFGDGTALHGGSREHDVTSGDRVVARVTVAGSGSGAVAARIEAVLGMIGKFALRCLPCALLVIAIVALRRNRRRAVAAAMAGLLASTSCGSPELSRSRSTLAAPVQSTFFHGGFGAGPVVFTDADGHLLEERRYEPFGAPIDAHLHTASGDIVGAPDLVARDLNVLNKRSDAATGWSDHGARWLAPETGRWLSTDPPVAAPSASFMWEPWSLHPYQYVSQNPSRYWDPTGNDGVRQPPGAPPRDVVAEMTRRAVVYGAYATNHETTWFQRHPTLTKVAKGAAIGAVVGVLVAGGWVFVAGAGATTGLPGSLALAAATGGDAAVVGAGVGVESGAAVGAAAGAGTELLGAQDLSNSTIVCRGGTCTPHTFTDGTGVTTDSSGNLHGVSVTTGPTLQDAAVGVRHNQVGATTVGEVRAAGGQVVPTPTQALPHHATLSGITAERASELFTPTVRNPSK